MAEDKSLGNDKEDPAEEAHIKLQNAIEQNALFYEEIIFAHESLVARDREIVEPGGKARACTPRSRNGSAAGRR